jgi:hypothetical protein
MDSPFGRHYSVAAWLASVRWPVAARLLVGAVGLALVVVGAVKSGVASGSAGALTLVIAGAFWPPAVRGADPMMID